MQHADEDKGTALEEGDLKHDAYDEAYDTIGTFKRAWNNLLDMQEGRASLEVIRARCIRGARLDSQHLIILAIAMLIASIGLNTDSTECVIGAMLICPIMGSVMALAFGIATYDSRLIRSAALALAIQIVICLLTSSIYFSATPLHAITDELDSNSTPTTWDVLVAIAGGFAGGLGITRKEEPATLIAGVAVATALMPPLCATGYGISVLSPFWFLFAFYEFLLNVLFIALSATIVFLLLRVPLRGRMEDAPQDEEDKAHLHLRSRRLRRRIFLATIIFAVPTLAISSLMAEYTDEYETETGGQHNDVYEVAMTSQELTALYPQITNYRVEQLGSPSKEGDATVNLSATVTSTSELSADEKEKAESLISVHAPTVKDVSFVVEAPEPADDTG